MAIQIITNFDVNAPAPIDGRNVVEDISARNAIEFKYIGLKTFVLSEGVTYVYGTNSEWIVDGGSSTNTGGNGIYGGSGSLPGDVKVFFGTVSNNIENRSNYLYFETDGQTDGDKSYLYNYGYRKNTGTDYDTMSYRTEQKLVPFGSSIKQGPFIEYNGRNPYQSDRNSVLNLGSGNQNMDSRVVRVSITPITTEFYSTQDPIGENEAPVAIHKLGGDTYFGYNTSGDPSLDNFTYDDAVPTYRMKFGLGINPNIAEWNFDTKIADSVTYNTIIKISASSEPNNVSSNLKFLIDTSSRDWDSNSTRTPQLLSPQEIVRNIEHRYTKLQMWNVGTFVRIESDILYLRSEGNSYEVELSPNQAIKDIKIEKSSSNKPDFPNGTIITIRFRNKDVTKPGYLKIYDGKIETSNIKSEITDATFELNDSTRLTINHLASPEGNGEVITLRKYNTFVFGVGTTQFWEIVNVNRARKITTRNWSEEGVGDWVFNNPVRYLTQFSTSGSFQSLGETQITNPLVSTNHPPNKWTKDVAFSGFSRESINASGFKFRISVDGNRIVFVQGNFQIYVKGDVRIVTQTQNLRKLFLKGDARNNLWLIGKVNRVSLIPQWESSWTYVKCWGRATQTGLGATKPIDITEAILSINRLGEIFISFDANTTDSLFSTAMQELFLEVSVPPFSYTAATSSFVQDTGG